MPPVDLEASTAPPRSYGALLFLLDDFAYGAHLRRLYALDPRFDDRPCYIAPANYDRAIDLFERVPEVGFPANVHNPAWSALEAARRALTTHPALLALVRGEPTHGAVSYGYHASASYEVVRDAIAERVPVYELRALREGAAGSRVAISESARQQALARLAPEASPAEHDEMRRWLRGERPFDPRWTALSSAALAQWIAGSFDPRQPADERIARQLASTEQGVRAWIAAITPDPLEDDFAPVRAYLSDAIGESALLRQCLLASGGQPQSGAWWWALSSLRDGAAIRAMLRGESDAIPLVEALVVLAKSSKSIGPIAADLLRAIVSDNPLWKRIVKAAL